MLATWGLALILAISFVNGDDLGKQVCSTDTTMIDIDYDSANVVFGGFLDLRSSSADGFGCGSFVNGGIQLLEAYRFTIKFLNNFNGGQGYVPGIKFGMRMYDSCISKINTYRNIQKLYPQTTAYQPYCANSSPTKVNIGMIGGFYSATAVPGALYAKEIPVTMLSPGGMGEELTDKTRFPTFLRINPPFADQFTPIALLMNSLQWQKIIVIHTDDTYSQSGYENMLKISKHYGICIDRRIKLPLTGSIEVYKKLLEGVGPNNIFGGLLSCPSDHGARILAIIKQIPTLRKVHWILINAAFSASWPDQMKGSFFVIPKYPDITSFKNYFVGLEQNPANVQGNHWFKEWYEQHYQCSLDDNSPNKCVLQDRTTLLQNFEIYPFVWSAIKSVLAFAETFKKLCPPGTGLCNNVLNASPQLIQDTLQSLDITVDESFFGTSLGKIKFNANGDLQSFTYAVHQYNNVGSSSSSFKEVGVFKDGILSISGPLRFYQENRVDEINGTLQSLCGTSECSFCIYPPQNVQFQYTTGNLVIASLVNTQINSNDVSTCGDYSAKQLASIVAAQWAVTEYKKDPNKLRGVSVGSLAAEVCPTGDVAAGFLNELLGSTQELTDDYGHVIPSERHIYAFVDDTDDAMAKHISNVLSQYGMPEIRTGVSLTKIDNPYISTIVPTEEAHMKALTSLLLTKEWNHIKIVKDAQYADQAMKFKEFAARQGICVVSMIDFNDGASVVLEHLLSNTESFVAVTFGSASNIKGLFDQIKTTGNMGNVQIVAGMADWATDPNYFDLTTSQPEYTITFGLKTQMNKAFQTYLQGLTEADILSNSLLISLFEATHNCALLPSSRISYSKDCTRTESLGTYQGTAPFMIQAIYNVLDKLHEMITEVCGPNYNELCIDFLRLTDKQEQLALKLRNTVNVVNGESSVNIVYYVIRNEVYKEIGTYSPQTQTISLTASSNLLNTKFNRATTCSLGCVACQYLYTYRNIMYSPGDFIIAGSFSASSSGQAGLQPYMCGNTTLASGSLMATAMMYALEQVNSKKAPVSVNGINVGGLVLDHCDNKGRQTLMVSDIYSGFLEPSLKVNPNKIISWVTSGTTSSNETALLLDPLDVSIISPDASGESLLQSYDNFYRTIQGDGSTSEAFIKLAKKLGFQFLQVVYDSSSEEAKSTLMNRALAEGVCVTQAVLMDDTSQATNVVKNLLQKDAHVVIFLLPLTKGNALFEAISTDVSAKTSLVIITPQSYKSSVEMYGHSMTYPPLALQFGRSSLTNFKKYLDKNPIDNPFFAQYYMKIFECNLEGYNLYSIQCTLPLASITTHAQFEDSDFDLSTINAVYASVDAMDRTKKEYCGTDYTESCTAFLQASDLRQRFSRNLQSVNFIDESANEFRFLQREGNSAFDVLQYDKTKITQEKVGSYAGVSLVFGSSFENSYRNVKSACSLPCLECINTGLEFSLTPGDIYLAGVFDVHQTSSNPFSCGNIKTLHGFLLVEAFHYALEEVNAKNGQFKNILNGVKLGGIGLDACSSRVRGGQLVSNINNNLTPIIKGSTSVDASQIDAYIGSYESDSSRYLARILTDLEIPQISYSAASTDLSDHRIYPYFYRTVPSNIHQARAILTYLNENNIRYIQVLYAGNNYGETGRDELVKLAAEYKVCVAQTVEYNETGVASLDISKRVVSHLLEKPSANTVVMFLETEAINSVLRTIGITPRAQNKLRFVGSDVWADNMDVIDGAETYAVDSVTLKLDADDVSEFESYINSKTLANSAGNPWFEEYYQVIHNCYTTSDNPYGFARACPQSLSSIISSSRYQQDPNVITVINSVYASALALHKTLTELCGSGYQSVCQAYQNNVNRRLRIHDNLADVSFVDPSGSDFHFTDKEVKLNFRLNAVVVGDLQGVIYQQFATYNTSGMTLSAGSAYTPSRQWNSDCDREDACSECPAIRDSITRYTFYPQTLLNPEHPVIVGFFDIHHQGVDSYRCGQLNTAGYQQFLAFLHGVDKYTSTTNTGIRVLAIDTCSNPVRLEQDLFGLLQGTGICNTEFNVPTGVSISASSISSIVVSGDLNTMAASRLLEQLNINYISPNARSPLLDQKMNLARSVAPISADMKYLSELVSSMGWSYVDVLYEETAEGYDRWHSLQYWSARIEVCLGLQLAIGVGSNDQEFASFFDELNGERGSNVVVLLGSKQYFKRAFNINGADVVEDYVWVLASEEKIDEQFIEDISPADKLVKIISFYNPTEPVQEFSTLVSQFRYSSNSIVNGKGPKEWQEEFFQIINDCTIPSASKVLNKDKQECVNARLNMDNFNQDAYVVNTMAALYAASRGVNALDLGSFNADTNRILIRTSVLAASKILPDQLDVFKFNDQRWWQRNYTINYWIADDRDVVKVEMNEDDAVNQAKSRLNITSMCSETQAQGFCGCIYGNAFTAPVVALPYFMPGSHRNYYKYDNEDERTFTIPVWAIVVSVLTGIGLLITVILFLILIVAYPKKGGTSILGYMMIFGIMCIYAVNFLFFFSATDQICGARRFLMGVVYAICFAPLLIKAVDNWKFGDMDYTDRTYSGITSACCLLLTAIALVLIQCIIPIMWLILEHPKAHTWVFGGEYRHDNDWCAPADDYDLGLVLSFSYVVLLVLITAIFAALSYQTDSNNFESRWILFASVATAGCFLVWMIVTTNAEGVYRDPAVAIANFVNASILLIAIPFRKTVLMVQNKNTKNKNPYNTNIDIYTNPDYELSFYD